MSVDRFPEIARLVVIDPINIDQVGVTARFVPDNPAPLAGDIDREGQTVADRLTRRYRSR